MENLHSVRVQLAEIVKACGKIVVDHYHLDQYPTAQDKDEQLGAHFSTRADHESQELAIEMLEKKFPGLPIIAEEQENAAKIPPECIVLDPLDGTTNFFNKRKISGVSACIMANGKPCAGATYFANDGMIVSASTDGGCWITNQVSNSNPFGIPRWHGQLDKTMLGTDVGPWVHKSGTFDQVLRPLSEKFTFVSNMAAVEGAREVLRGWLGAYWNIGIAKIWDAAAMALAVEEAGGVVCAPDGGPVKWDNIRCDWVMAGNQKLADIVLEHTIPWAKVH